MRRRWLGLGSPNPSPNPNPNANPNPNPGTIEVRCADALQLGAAGAAGGALAAASVDLVLADLPYGAQHARLDVGALLRALSRVVRLVRVRVN